MVRFASPRIAAALVFCSLACAWPASAQESAQPEGVEGEQPEGVEGATTRTLSGLSQAATIPAPLAAQPRRPSSLVPLYVSFGALQILDAHSTSRAIESGAAEANPVMKPFAGSTAGMLAIKAAGTAGVIYASEKMWRKNRKAAVIFMLAANTAMAWVVQNNYRVSTR